MKKIIFLDDESQAPQQCKSEWTQHGTYCYPDLASTYQNEDRNLMTILLSKLNKSLSKIAQIVQNILDLFEKLKKEKSLEAFGPLKRLEEKLGKERVGEFLKSLREFVDRHTKPQQIRETVTCWGRMMEMREKTICFVCSGRHQQFEAGSKLVISADSCSAVVGTCKAQFKLLATIGYGLTKFFTKIRDTLKEGGLFDRVLIVPIDKIIQQLSTIESKKILKLIQEISKAKNQEQVAKSEADFCQNIIALVKNPFLQFLTPIFEKTEKAVVTLKNSIDTITNKLSAIGAAIRVRTAATRSVNNALNKLPNAAPILSSKDFKLITPSVKPVTQNPQAPLHNLGTQVEQSFSIFSKRRLTHQSSNPPQFPSSNHELPQQNNFNQQNAANFMGDVVVAPVLRAQSFSNSVTSIHTQHLGGKMVSLPLV